MELFSSVLQGDKHGSPRKKIDALKMSNKPEDSIVIPESNTHGLSIVTFQVVLRAADCEH